MKKFCFVLIGFVYLKCDVFVDFGKVEIYDMCVVDMVCCYG